MGIIDALLPVPTANLIRAKALTLKLAEEAAERFKQLDGRSKSAPSPSTIT
jgi:hypothetical protein